MHDQGSLFSAPRAFCAPSNRIPHTAGHLNCPACEELRTTMLSSIGPETEFTEAARLWMEARAIASAPGALTARYIRKTTEESYRQYIRTLGLFFDGHKLGDIHPGNLATYQQARIYGTEPFVRHRRPQDASNGKGKTPCPAKPKKVNQELGLLKRILKRGKCWPEDWDEMYQTLLDDQDEIPRALTPHEQRHWLDVARMRERWNTVYLYSIFAFDTLMSTNEVRGLRLGDINLFQRIVTVPRKIAKVRQRARTIELENADVLWAIERLLERARDMGATEPGHYLFPWRHNITTYDPSRPMSESGIKVAWNEVREASGLGWFRQYDTRHTGITRLAEAGVPVPIIKARAGHISQRMSDHYTHVAQSVQRQWMQHAASYHKIPPQRVPGEWGQRKAQ